MDDHFQKDRLYHEAVAREYDAVVVAPRALTNDALFKQFSRLVKPGRRMLDLACGTGHMTFRFGDRFTEVVAVDHSQAMLEEAKRKAEQRNRDNIIFIQSDILAYLEAEEKTFDFVSCVGFLHHLRPEEVPEMIRTISFLLCPAGILLISEPVVVAGGSIPGSIAGWNSRSVASRLGYSVTAEEPEEKPLAPAFLLQAITTAGLVVLKVKRNFEIFPRQLPPRLKDMVVVKALNLVHGRRGNVMTIAAKKA